MELLNLSIEVNTIKYIFHRTTADGNCMFNACSLALIGDESLASCLRPLTSIELYLNAEYYSTHPYIEEVVKKRLNLNKKNIFCQFLSFQALDSSSFGDPISAVYKEAENNVTSNTFSSFLCLLALSTVTRQPIESYFPIANDEFLSEDKRTSHELIFNGCIFPRANSESCVDKIHLFRCAAAPIQYLYENAIPEKKNHFVPLLPHSMCATESKYSHPKERKYQKSSTGSFKEQTLSLMPVAGPSFSPMALPLEKDESVENSNIKPLILDKKKQKQVKIDTLLFKKLKKEKTVPVTSFTATSSVEDPSIQCDTYRASAPEEEDTSRKALFTTNHQANDIGHFYKDLYSFPDSKKHSVISNLWKPEISHCFLANASGRKFQHHWLSQFSWLVYSKMLNGAFCIDCVAFATTTSTISNLVKTPLTNWNNALERFKSHTKSPTHLTAS